MEIHLKSNKLKKLIDLAKGNNKSVLEGAMPVFNEKKQKYYE